MSFVNEHDFILFRQHTYKTKKGNEVDLNEVGPRFTMRLYQIKLGTLEEREADVEWVLVITFGNVPFDGSNYL